MKQFVNKASVLIALITLLAWAQNIHAREYTLLNNHWKFAKGHAANPALDFNYGRALSFSKISFLQESTMLEHDQQSNLSVPHVASFNDSQWENIDLPHDWGMGEAYGQDQFKVKGYRKLGGRSPENSVGWYRKKFEIVPLKDDERLTLQFEGVFRDAQIWVNGVYQGRHESGYTGFEFDVTESVHPGKDNVITVRVDATHSELWSYEGAGIYRNVWLIRTSDIHVPQGGTYVASTVNANGSATVVAQTEIKNETSETCRVELRSIIRDAQGQEFKTESKTVEVPALEVVTVSPTCVIPQAKLWSLKTPQMYTLTSQVVKDGRIVDSYETPFGIRTIRFDPDEGFFLNGERVQIQGVCCHQDHAGVGIGVPDNLNAWRIKQLKKYGVNSYRASHNPPTISVLNACDTLGVLVLDELRVLSSSKEGLEQLEYTIRRDRNHPSVILWCLGNEEPAIQGSEKGRKIIERMKQHQRKLDPSRLSTAAMNGSWGEGFTKAVDVQGSNYHHIGNMDQIHKDFPNLPMLLTEEGSTVTTRGEYKTIPEKGIHQAYDRDFPGWGDSAEGWMRYVAARPYIAGTYVWTGFDYGGEATIHYWPGVSSHFGILDYCGFPKDAYWYYKAWWTNEPVLHILPHWNKEGLPSDSVEVHIYSNMESVELTLNGKSLGKQTLKPFDIAKFKVKYAPGTLEAKGVRQGKKYRRKVETTGTPTTIALSCEPDITFTGKSNEVTLVRVEVLDSKKRLVPTASSNLSFTIENGTIVGVGNGHPSCQERDCFRPGEPVSRSVFHGLAQVIVKGDGSGKPIVLKAHAEGLNEAALSIPTAP